VKQKDITLILVVAFVSAIISYSVANFVFGTPQRKSEKVEVVEKITEDFNQPDKRYFNENSVNPTQIIEIKGNENQQPAFGSVQ
jgi:hypothetical protein